MTPAPRKLPGPGPRRHAPLRRSAPLKANPETTRAWERRSRKPLPRRTKLRKRNPVRLGRLRAQQFGTDGKRAWVILKGCVLSGARNTSWNPVDPAHVGGTRAAGAGPECMAGLRRWPEHRDFDNLSEAAFERKYGRPKEWVTEQGHELEREWQALKRALA